MSATAARALPPIERLKDRAFYTGMAVSVIATIYRGLRTILYSARPVFLNTAGTRSEVARRSILVMGWQMKAARRRVSSFPGSPAITSLCSESSLRSAG